MTQKANPSENNLPSIEDVLGDPGASFWLKNSLHTALARDPVDAANDADVLARLLDRRCREILNSSRYLGSHPREDIPL